MTRSVEEWRDKTDDSAIPPRVRLRVFDRHGGICFLSGRKIRPGEQWDCDHAVALINGGEHRESNCVPVLKAPHKAKTAADVAEKSKVYRKRASHVGIKVRKGRPMLGSRASGLKKCMSGRVVRREA